MNCFFFFKQKTAYEMRISDWSSDVCSSDLDLDYHVRYSALPAPGSMDQLMKLVERLHSRLLDRTRPLWECYYIEGLENNQVAQIGRASCRERVCQYV